MRKKLVALVIICVAAITTIMFAPLPVQVFAFENTSTEPPFVRQVLGNLTLEVENFSFSIEYDNETYTLQIESANIEMLTYSENNSTQTIINIKAQNLDLTSPTTLSFSYLELHITITMQTDQMHTYVDAVTYMPVWKHLQNMAHGVRWILP